MGRLNESAGDASEDPSKVSTEPPGEERKEAVGDRQGDNGREPTFALFQQIGWQNAHAMLKGGEGENRHTHLVQEIGGQNVDTVLAGDNHVDARGHEAVQHVVPQRVEQAKPVLPW